MNCRNLKYNTDKLRVVALGDVHFGGKECDITLFKQKLDWIKQQKDLIVVLMGDLINCGTKVSIGAGTFDDDYNPEEQYEKMLDLLKPIQNKIVLAVSGNHESRIRELSSFDITKLLCRELNIYYADEGSALLDVRVKKQHYIIHIKHGMTGSGTMAGKMNGCLKMAEYADADIFCFDENTELLTQNGFKKYNELSEGEPIFNLDIYNNTIEPDNISNIISYPAKEIYSLKTKRLQMDLTENHRVVYKYKNDWLVDSVKNIKNKKGQIEIPLAGQQIVEEDNTISIDEARLIGWLVSEGHFRKEQSLIQIFQKKKANVKKIKNLLQTLGYKFSSNTRKDGLTVFNIFHKDSKEIRKRIINTKMIPDYCFNFGKEKFDAMLETLLLGDGSNSCRNNYVYYSKDEKLIDKLQALCVINNYRTKKVSRKHGYSNTLQYELIINDRPNTTIALHRSNFSKIKYNGIVWCANTTNGTLIVRKNGRVFISGNCMGHVHSLQHVVQMFRRYNRKNKIVDEQERHFITTGAFLDWDGSYGESKGYAPLKKGMPTLHLSGKKFDVQVEM